MTALDERPAARGHAWQRHAACNTAPTAVEFFPKSRRTPTDAYAYCDSCPVRPDCLADASRQAAAYGVWGAVLWIDGKPAPRTERADRPERAVHARVPDETRAAVVADFDTERGRLPSDNLACIAVGQRHGLHHGTVARWVRAARRARQAAHDTDTDGRHRP